MYHAHIVNALYHDHFFSHFIFCHVSYIFNQYYVSCDCYQCYVSAQIILTVFISKLHIQDGDAHQSHQELNEHIMDQAVDDNVHHNISHVLPEKTTTDSSVHFSILIYDTQFHYTQIYSKNHYIIFYRILQLQQQYLHPLKQQ